MSPWRWRTCRFHGPHCCALASWDFRKFMANGIKSYLDWCKFLEIHIFFSSYSFSTKMFYFCTEKQNLLIPFPWTFWNTNVYTNWHISECSSHTYWQRTRPCWKAPGCPCWHQAWVARMKDVKDMGLEDRKAGVMEVKTAAAWAAECWGCIFSDSLKSSKWREGMLSITISYETVGLLLLFLKLNCNSIIAACINKWSR